MPTYYPTETDLERYLMGGGLISLTPTLPAALLDMSGLVLQARSNYEGAVGRTMLAVSATRLFDPPTYPRTTLPFNADLASATTVGIVNGATTTTLVSGTDYYLGPQNFDLDGRPFKFLEFAVPPVAARKSVSILGLWGYATNIPDGAWEAILARACFLAYPQIAASISKGLLSWQQDDLREEYGPKPYAFLRDQWEQLYEGGVQRFKNTTTYISQ